MNDGSILIVDDEHRVRASLKRILKNAHQVLEAASGREALKVLDEKRTDVVLLDYFLLDTDASELLPKVLNRPDRPEVIIISGKANTNEAVNCLRQGAFDFLVKPYLTEELIATLENALRKRILERQNEELLQSSLARYKLIGDSPQMQSLREDIQRFANSHATVLVHGETGTGKELVAHQLHFCSPRCGDPLQVVNCAAVPQELANSELFGHVRGAYTGAHEDKQGKLELADGGTLFLDEVGEMPMELQAKLLRFLEDGTFERVGENRVRTSNVRVIAATHRNLDERIEEGKFRRDLFFRLNVCSIKVPPLRRHLSDIPELVYHFGQTLSSRNQQNRKRFTAESLKLLQQQSWPGNVRQLRNFIEQVTVYTPGDEISATDVQNLLQRGSDKSPDLDGEQLSDILEKVEKQVIAQRLAEHSGRIDKAAESLGIHRSSLHRKMTKYSLSSESDN